jgi:hypothetical protein
MKSSKWILGLMVAVLVVALAPSSFAQVNIQIFNTASPAEVQTAHNAQTSDPSSSGNGILVSGALIANSPLTATQMIFTFPAVITSEPAAVTCLAADGVTPLAGCPQAVTAVPAGDPLRIDGATGLFAGALLASVNYGGGTVTITLPASANNTSSGTFRLVGTRIDVNGKTAPLTASASLSSSSNNYILQTTSVPIISALGAGIGSMTIGTNGSNTNNGTALLFTNQTNNVVADPNASIVIAEGFASAWRTTSQVNTNGVDSTTLNGNMIRLTVSGVPAGMAATFTIAGTGGVANAIPGTTGAVFLTGGATSANLDNSSSGAAVAYIKFVSTNLAAVESLQLNVVISGTPTSALAAGTITVAATMGPVGNALSSGLPNNTQSGTGNPGTSGGLTTNYVRFAQADTTLTIASIVSANTTLLIPYAVKVGAYDTGIAIANTTLDPFGSSGGATPAAGTMTFTMFPRNATGADPSFALTTSSTIRPGVGLSTSGTLVAGGTWTGLMSDIMTAAGKTGDYFGYIFIQTNFLNAHGSAYIFNGAGFTSSTNVLVLLPPAQTSRNTATAEQLSF